MLWVYLVLPRNYSWIMHTTSWQGSENIEKWHYFAVCAAATTITVDEINNREYPWSIKLAQVFVTGGIVLFFFAVLYWSSLAWAAFLTLFGRYQVRSELLTHSMLLTAFSFLVMFIVPSMKAKATPDGLIQGARDCRLS